jgi:hypothetical protein
MAAHPDWHARTVGSSLLDSFGILDPSRKLESDWGELEVLGNLLLGADMKEYYIEVFRPPFPEKGHKIRVFRKFVGEALSPDLLALYRVKALDVKDALALVMLGEAFTMISPNAKPLQFA